MLYHSHPADPLIFFFHATTGTLAELRLNEGPGGDHVLRVASDSPPPDEAFAAIAAYLHGMDPHAAQGLIIYSRAELAQTLPEYVVLIHENGSVIIHYPAVGFTAGIAGDGSKIPPSWRNPDILTPQQRSHFLDSAAQNLLKSPVFQHLKRQAT